jgi:hypothetical protein
MRLPSLLRRGLAGARPAGVPRRRAALAMTWALIAFPLLDAPAGGTDAVTVTFSGTPSTSAPTACPSTPDVKTLTVAAGTTVNFADELGKPATLWANDSSKHMRDDEMVPVTFIAPATVYVKMLPDCPLDLGTHGVVTVIVTSRPTPSGTTSSAGNDNPFVAPPGTPSPSTADTADRMRLAAPVSSEPPAPHGASGLLTLIATVCIAGVTIAALRAVVAQRATRTFFQ